MNVGIDSTGGDNLPFAGDHFRSCSYHESCRYSSHDVRISRFTYPSDAPAANADVRFNDSPMVDDDGVCDDEVQGALCGSSCCGLAHSVAKYFSAAEFGFIAGSGKIALDFHKQIGISQPYTITRRRAVELSVLPAGNIKAHRSSFP